MTLSEILSEKKQNTIKNAPAEKVKIMLEATENLKKEFLSKKALTTGATIPDFKLLDINNQKVTLRDFEADFIVISFYRGGWCPYCNLELKALQEILPELKKLNGELIAISPETPDNSLTTAEKNEIEFAVLSDVDNVYAKLLGLVFKMPDNLITIYKEFGLHVDKYNGNENYELPMPVTYIINKNKEVIYSFVSEDYTKRLEPSLIIKTIKENI